MKDFREEYDIKLHNEIRWILEDYIGEFDLKRECVDKIIEKVKSQFQAKDKVIDAVDRWSKSRCNDWINPCENLIAIYVKYIEEIK